MKNITLAIGTHNRLEYTKRTVNSILRNTRIKYNLIIVDDNSTDGTIEYLKELDRLPQVSIYLQDSCGWICRTFNLKRKYACSKKTEFIMLLDNDIEVRPGWIGKAISAYRILQRGWKGKPVSILKLFNRGEKSYKEIYNIEGCRFARTNNAGGVGWLMETRLARQNLEHDLNNKIELGFGLGSNYIDNRNYRTRLSEQGFEDVLVLLEYPSLIDHIGIDGVHTNTKSCPRGARTPKDYWKF